MEVPSDYKAGLQEGPSGRRRNRGHLPLPHHIGDPVMDAVVEELASLPRRRLQRFIRAGMEGDRDDMRNAPKLLRDFFVDAPQPNPEWRDYSAFAPDSPRLS